MRTLGDHFHDLSQFFSFKRSQSVFKARQPNPVTQDIPPGGKYANIMNWSDERQGMTALYQSWAFAGIQRIGLAALASHLCVERYTDEKEEEIINHPIEMLIRNPNKDLSREFLMLHTIASLYLKAAFWFLYPDSQGNIAELWPMPPSRVTPIPDESRNPERLFSGFLYRFRWSGEEMIINPANVVYLRFPHPFSLQDSFPPLKPLLKPIALDNNQTEWNNNFLDTNKGLPASIVSVPAELDNEQLEMVRRDLRDSVGQRMVTRAGTISVQFMQETHQEMQFTEGRDFNKKEIWTILGIPENIDTQDGSRIFIDTVVWPVLQMLAGQITTQLMRPYFGDGILAKFLDIRMKDRSIQVQESIQYAPFRSINEERASRKEAPLAKVVIPEHIADFAGKSLYDDVPSKLVDALLAKILAGESQPQPAQLQDGFVGIPSMAGSAGAAHSQVMDEMSNSPEMHEMQQDTSEPQPEDMTKSYFENWQEIAIKKLARGKSPAHVYIDSAIDNEESYTIATVLGLCRKASEVKAVFEHLDDYLTIKAQIGASGDIPQSQLDQETEFTGPLQEWLAEQATRIALNTRNGEPLDQSFWDREQKLLAAFLVAYVANWVEAGIAETVVSASALGIGIDATVNAKATEWAGQYALDMAKGLTETTRELARAKIKQWITARGSFAELEQSLGQIIAPQWRASLIAQTEITRAYAQANLQIAKELKVEKGLTWATRQDERVCPFCSPNHGKLTNKVGLPPAHPRCRCGTVMVL